MRPDPNDPESLLQFFEEHEFHTTFEQAKLAGVHPKTIREWRRLCSWEPMTEPETSFMEPHSTERKQLPSVADPEVWDNREWFEEFYTNKGYGTRTIGRIIGRSHVVVSRRLKRYEIERRTFEETTGVDHTCCSIDWLQEHYIDEELSLRKCADLAGVNPYTIYNWLVMFDFDIRDRHEALAIAARGRKLSEETKQKIRDKYKPHKYWQKPDQ